MARTCTNDYAVIGLGRFGSSVALTLMQRGCSVLGIDRDTVIVQRLADELTQTAALDTTDEDALRAVDIGAFRIVIVAIGTNFEANLLTLAALKQINSICTVICKATTVRQREILLKVGADQVVLPEYDAGQRLAENLTTGGKFASLEFGEKHGVARITAPLWMAGLRVADIDLTRKFGVRVLSARRGDKLESPPSPDRILARDDELLVLGRKEDIVRLSESA